MAMMIKEQLERLPVRMLMLVTALTLLALSLLMYMAYEEHRLAYDNVSHEVRQAEQLLSGMISQKVEGSRQLLSALSHSPFIVGRNAAMCNKLFPQIRKDNPQLANLAAADIHGRVFCSVVPLAKAVNVSGLAWFQRTLHSGEFSVGEYQVGRITDKHVLVFGYPAKDANNNVTALVYSPLDLSWVSGQFREAGFPPGAAISLFDRNGTILARHPDHEQWVGKTLTGSEGAVDATILQKHQGIEEAKGNDGITRIYAFGPVPGTNNGLYVKVGRSKKELSSAINVRFARNLAIVGIFGILSVILALHTGRLAERSEREMMSVQENLKEAQSIAHIGCWKLDIRKNDLWWSEETYGMFGIHQGDPMKYEKFLAAVHPDDKENVDRSWQAALAGRPYDVEHRIIVGGEIRWVREKATIRFNEKLEPLAGIGIVQDITERRNMEEALRERERKYREIFNATTDAIFLHEIPGGRILDVNDSMLRMYGYDSKEEALACAVGDLSSGESPYTQEEAGKHIRQAIEAGPQTFEWHARKRNGDLFWVEVSLYYSSVAGESRVLAAVRDITDRKLAEEELRKHRDHLEYLVRLRTEQLAKSQHALTNIVEDLQLKSQELADANEKLKEIDKLKSMFIASMSHELRTPLNSIIGFSSILLHHWKGPLNEDQQLMAATVLRSGRHLLSLINDVIDVSKIEAGRVDSTCEEFELSDLMAEAVDFVAKDAAEKKLELRMESISLPMYTDRRRLLQCLLNLLSNAVKFTERGSVLVTARTGEDDLVEIAVKDTGIGIEPENMPRLFEAFSRIKSTAQTTAPGTGLGLYLTRKLVQDALQGDVSAASEFGKGSMFTLKIPARKTRTAETSERR